MSRQASQKLLASFYGGFSEEDPYAPVPGLGISWILGHFWQNDGGLPTNGAYWTAIVVASVLFGLGHVPITRALTPLTPMIVVRAVVLNGVFGIATGWLYWKYGLGAVLPWCATSALISCYTWLHHCLPALSITIPPLRLLL